MIRIGVPLGPWLVRRNDPASSPAAIWFDLGDSLAAGGDSKRSPRSAHGCSRFISAAIWFDLEDIPPAGGDSRRSPRSAHGCSRFYPLQFDLT